MICPHCRKPIDYKKLISDEIKREVIEFYSRGFSCRDIQDVLGVSFSSAARIIRDAKKDITR